MALETAIGMVIALTLNAHMPGRGLLRAAVLIPWAIPTVVSAKMWSWMLNDQYGVMNAMLLSVGLIDQPLAWLANPTLSMVSIIAVDVWKATPFMALLILAALQTLPGEVYEAARVDGVHPVKVFFRVTLPLIRPALLVAVIFRGLDALRVFDVIYVLTGNNENTASMSVYARQQLVENADVGYGSTAATCLFLVVAHRHGARRHRRPGECQRQRRRPMNARSHPRPRGLLRADRRHHLLRRVPLLLGDRLVAENRQRASSPSSPSRPIRASRTIVTLFAEQPFARNILNSLIVATVATAVSLFLAVTAAYALGRVQFRGRAAMLFAILSVSMFPQIAVLSGMFELIRLLGLYNTLTGLILSYLILTLPFTAWVLTAFMRELPRELEEAAIIDGASPWRILTRVFLPVMGPALAATGLLAFIVAWNEFLFALTFTLSTEKRTVPVAIALITGASAYELPWGRIMAASVIVTVPLILLVLALQRRIVSGLTAGAVKG